MGLVLVLIAGVAFVLVAVPAALLGLVVLRKSQRQGPFNTACLATLLISVCAQYASVVAPIISSGKADFELFVLPLFGWHMAPPFLLALVLWIATRTRQAPALHGVVAGLLFSIAAMVMLSMPLGFLIPQVFGLKFTP